MGRLVNSGGAPVEGVLVRAHHKVDSENGPAGVLSNASGDFELSLQGETRLEVTHSGYFTADVESGVQVIVLTELPITDPVQFSGVVVDEDGHTSNAPRWQGYQVAALHPEGGALVAGVQVGDEIVAANTCRQACSRLRHSCARSEVPRARW